MQYKLGILTLLILCGLTQAADLMQTPVQIDRGYFPPGFHEFETVDVMITGNLITTCAELGTTAIDVDEATHRVFVQQFQVTSSGRCGEIVRPFQQVIKVEGLKFGTYLFIDETTGNEFGQIDIARAPFETTKYAPVTDAEVRALRRTEGGWDVLLTGDFPGRCVQLKTVNITYTRDVILVEPIVTEGDTGTGCGVTPVPYRFATPLRKGTLGTWLLSVRTNGEPINKLVTLY